MKLLQVVGGGIAKKITMFPCLGHSSVLIAAAHKTKAK